VARDEARGTSWLLKAAQQGDLESEILMAVAFENGTGVARDDEQASYWYLAAAMQGDGDSQRAIAVRYAQGQGIAKDPALAYAWFRIANRERPAPEESFLARYLPGVDPKDLAQGRSLAEAWQVNEAIRRK
jgi:TPR repeat protein